MKKYRFKSLAILCALLFSIVALTLNFIKFQAQTDFISRLQRVVKVYGPNDANGRLLSFGKYSKISRPQDLIIFSSQSRLEPQFGQPSIKLYNQLHPQESVELGFYHYGPTLVSDNSIFEFWLGNIAGQVASVSILNKAGGPNSTARLEIRYPSDTGALVLDSNYQYKGTHTSRIWQTAKSKPLLMDLNLSKRDTIK